MNKFKLSIPLALVAALALVGCRTAVPIENVSTASYGSDAYTSAQDLSLKDYEKRLLSGPAHTESGWQNRSPRDISRQPT